MMGKEQRPIETKSEVSDVCAQLRFVAELCRAEELIPGGALLVTLAQNRTNRQTESDGLRSPQHKELITWSTSSWWEGLYALNICSSDLQRSDTM